MACLDDGVIARYVRGEGPFDEVAWIREHLSRCPACEIQVAQARETWMAAARTQPLQGARGELRLSLGSTTSTGDIPLQPAPLLERGATVGRYLVVNPVGEGGMGVVYAAYDPELNRRVAVKLLRAGRARGGGADEGQARLLREAQAMARIQHPNVIAVYDVGTLDDRVFVAMEFVEGSTLSGWAKEAPRSWRDVLAAFIEAGKGLAAAHEAGLVHRDFKPENVLIGKDGRVRVMDFGLARLESSPTVATIPNMTAIQRPATNGPGPIEAITEAGEVMGTPQYMSPEQRLGLVADARSDQFSFCAALYWALYREPPFDPMQLAAAAIEATDAASTTTDGSRPLTFTRAVIREPPREPFVPTWLKRVILRGLSLSPEARFPSMEALLAELRAHPTAVGRRWLAMAAAVVVGLGAAGLVYVQAMRRAQLCSGAEAQLANVWDAPTRRSIESAFLATGKPYAASAWAGVRQILDEYSAGWVAMRREACEDTRIRGVQTEQLLSLRLVCLDRRYNEMRALTRLLASADSEAVERAVDAAHALPSLTHCADVEALSAPVSPPGDPAAQAEIERISSTLASAKALGDAGKYKEALEVAQGAAVGASELRWLPLQAEALLELGWLQMKTGDARKGEMNLAEAVWTAEAGRHDEVKAVAATRLVYVVGYVQSRFEDAQPWIRLATSTLGRIGGTDQTRIELLTNIASMQMRQGLVAEAQQAYERAAALARKAWPQDPRRALVLTGLGINYVRQHELDRARSVLLEALELIEETRGPDHPSAAYPHNALADVFQAENEPSNALFHAQKAYRIWEAALGPEHPIVGTAHESVASIFFRQESFVAALAEYQRALEVKRKALGPEDPELSYSYDGIGQTYVKLGQPRQAIPYLEKALRLREDDPHSATTRFALAQALWMSRRDRARARSLATEARDSFLAAGSAERAAQVDAWLASSR